MRLLTDPSSLQNAGGAPLPLAERARARLCTVTPSPAWPLAAAGPEHASHGRMKAPGRYPGIVGTVASAHKQPRQPQTGTGEAAPSVGGV